MKAGAIFLLGAVAAGVAVSRVVRRGNYTFAGRTILLTGGSRGLGLVLARRLAAMSANLVLLARDAGQLQRAGSELSARGASVLAVPCDVGNPRQVKRAVREAVRRFGGVDVLINNAGVIQVGPVEHMEPADFERAMATHFWGPYYLTQAVLPLMREAGEGRIVNISSIGGKVAAPHLAPYSASKFALTGLSDALRSELRRENILVTTVIPGLMRTGSPPNAQFKGRHREEYAWFSIADSLPLVSMNAERAARRILAACQRGDPHLVLGLPTKIAIWIDAMFPNTSGRIASRVNQLLPDPQEGDSPRIYTGWQSESSWAPSFATRPTYKAAERNNEK